MKKTILLIVLMIFMLFSLTSCTIKKYSQIDDVKYEDILKKSNLSATTSYYVLVYRNGCAVCEEIEPYVCEYATIVNKKPSIDKIYVLNKSDKKNNGGISAGPGVVQNRGYGATNYNEIKLATAPVLLKITKGKVVALYDTKTAIKSALSELISRYE